MSFPTAGFAQAYHAPSIYLWYNASSSPQEGPIDILTFRTMVNKTAANTYFEVFGWNFGSDGGGYTGLQDSGSLGKNVIFSLWDPTKSIGRTASSAYSAPNSQVARFGGEGAGLHYLNYSFGWKTRDWYRIVARRWDYNGDSYFGFWTLDESAGIWTHQVTMDYPEHGIYFSSPCAFLEDWAGTGQHVRRFACNDGWCDHEPGGWTPIAEATFDVNRDKSTDGPYFNSLDGGIDHNSFYLQSGGNTVQTTAANTKLAVSVTGTSPNVAIGSVKIKNAVFDRTARTIFISWSVDPRKCPQFSYEVTAYPGHPANGGPGASKSDISPEARSITLSIPASPTATLYTVQLTVTDVLNRVMGPKFIVVKTK
jgi:hypothetical protein